MSNPNPNEQGTSQGEAQAEDVEAANTARADRASSPRPAQVRIELTADTSHAEAEQLLRAGGELNSMEVAQVLFELLGGYETERTDVVFFRRDGDGEREFSCRTMCAAIGQNVEFRPAAATASGPAKPVSTESSLRPSPAPSASVVAADEYEKVVKQRDGMRTALVAVSRTAFTDMRLCWCTAEDNEPHSQECDSIFMLVGENESCGRP